MAATSIHVMNLDKATYDANTQTMLSHINVETAVNYTNKELDETEAKVVGFKGDVKCDFTKPNRALSKLMNVVRLKSLGWESSVNLEYGLNLTY